MGPGVIAFVRVCLVAATGLLLGGVGAFAWSQRRRQAAIDLLKQHDPARWRHLDREGGQNALRKWADKHPDAEDDDRLREALWGVKRMQQLAGRFAIPGIVLLVACLSILGLGPSGLGHVMSQR